MSPHAFRRAPRRARPARGALCYLALSFVAVVILAAAAETPPGAATDDALVAPDADDDDRKVVPNRAVPSTRASFPLRALPGDTPGSVYLTWTPPRTIRVFPSTTSGDKVLLGGDDLETVTETEKTAVAVADFGTRFAAATKESSTDRTYDVLIGACLDDLTPSGTPNTMPYAPNSCVVTTPLVEESDDTQKENSEKSNSKKPKTKRDASAFFNPSASPRKIVGTSFVVTGLTPGSRYAFRVVTSGAPAGAEDEDSVSGIAVAIASRGKDGDEDEKVSENLFASEDVFSSSRKFCGASQDAFPNGTALLNVSNTQSASGCCLACVETVGCNAWSFCGDAKYVSRVSQIRHTVYGPVRDVHGRH